ncbi:MAG: chemotaxis protein CheX [Planctomycetes bacterium]|nr:chemotaxis protein CheX [Planctomycetota bacterium]
MTNETLDPALVESLQDSAREILETMVFMTPDNIEVVPESSSVFRAEVVGLLGFTGTRSGTVVVRTTQDLAKTIAAKMLMMEPEELGSMEEACDGFGELVNMLSGNFKNAWVANGNVMDLSVPNVILSGEVRLNMHSDPALRTCVRIHVGGGQLDVGIHFEAV